MGACNRSGRAAHYRLRGAATVAAFLVAITACSDNRAGGKVQSNTSGNGQPETSGAPQVSASGGEVRGADSTQPNAQPNAQSNAQQGAQPGASNVDSSRARDIARAPRGNPAPNAGAGQPSVQPQPSQSSETSPTATASQPLRDKYHQPPKDTVSQVVYSGWKQFNLNCARCHGEDVTGTTIAPHLVDSFRSGKVDHTEFWNVVHGSRVLKGMPNWSGIIPDDQLESIYQYIKGRSEGKISPGRPAVKGS